MRRVLVTGGGGFLGRRVVTRLLARGCRVRVLGRHAYPDLAAQGAECVIGTLPGDTEALRAAVAGCDTVFHVAAKAGVWGSRRLFHEANVLGTDAVLDACLAAGVSRLVHTSTPSVVFGTAGSDGGDESLPFPARYLAAYPETKAIAEAHVLAANGRSGRDGTRLATCALRPHLIYGPGDPHLLPRLVQAARCGRLRQVGDGRNRVDVTYVENAAAAQLMAADALVPGGSACGCPYFIGDAAPVNLWEWLRALLGRLGLALPPRPLSFRTAYALAAALELVHRAAPGLGEPRLTRFVVSQLALPHWFSHARATSAFGYAPVVAPEDALGATVGWLRARHGLSPEADGARDGHRAAPPS